MKRVIFYFDGFNFYNGLREKSKSENNWKDYYWIDFVKFCNNFLSEEHNLIKVKYFTAPPFKSDKRGRQTALFNANKLINGDLIEFVNGKFTDKK